MATETTQLMTTMFQQATENFNETMRAGLKYQEETARFWTEATGKGLQQFQKQAEKVTDEIFPTANKNLKHFHQQFDAQAEKGLEMLQRTLESGEPRVARETIDQTMGMWRKSFDAMRSSVDMMSKANTDMFHNWSEMANKPCTPAGSKGNGKTAK